jgi:NAD+ kinase
MKIAFAASPSKLAEEAQAQLAKRYGQHDMHDADVVVTLGGDGKVLKTLYEVLDIGKPVFAMRRTESVGFLCNEFDAGDLPARIAKAQRISLHPLVVEARTADGQHATGLAFNEVVMIRETPQSARLQILIDGIERVRGYSGDGIMVATPAGSTAYNHSCGGPIMPLDANMLVITAICGYRPRGWSYAVLPQASTVEITALETDKRPVRIESGSGVIANAATAKIRLDRKKTVALLFDPDLHLGERIVREQFMLEAIKP